MRKFIAAHSLVEDAYYVVNDDTRQLIGEFAVRPINTRPYPGFTVYTGAELKTHKRQVWQRVTEPQASCVIAPAETGKVQGRHQTYPYVTYHQQRLNDAPIWGVKGPGVPEGILVGSLAAAHAHALKLVGTL